LARPGGGMCLNSRYLTTARSRASFQLVFVMRESGSPNWLDLPGLLCQLPIAWRFERAIAFTPPCINMLWRATVRASTYGGSAVCQ
jgi:hypothetical protein